MAKVQHNYGLTNIKAGAVAGDGDMGTTLLPISETVEGSMVLEKEDDTTTEFRSEESDIPVESIISQFGKITLAWSSYDVSGANLYRFLGGAYKPFKSVATLGTITAGTLYTNGTYSNVALTGGTGKGAIANITVASGGVTAVVLVEGGEGYTALDELSAPAISLGGTGSGFKVIAATIANAAAANTVWEAPKTLPELELSLEITSKKGIRFQIPRAKVVAKLRAPFTKDAMSQIDFVATVLEPQKSGVPPYSKIFPTI